MLGVIPSYTTSEGQLFHNQVDAGENVVLLVLITIVHLLSFEG